MQVCNEIRAGRISGVALWLQAPVTYLAFRPHYNKQEND